MPIERGDEKKFDAGKPMWDLLPLDVIEEIVQVLSYGATKYGAHSWQTLSDPASRYFAACMRHVTAWQKGEMVDAESGLPHLAHAAANLVFLMWVDRQRLCPVDQTQKGKCPEKQDLPDTNITIR